jgi:hypothetical protein
MHVSSYLYNIPRISLHVRSWVCAFEYICWHSLGSVYTEHSADFFSSSFLVLLNFSQFINLSASWILVLFIWTIGRLLRKLVPGSVYSKQIAVLSLNGPWFCLFLTLHKFLCKLAPGSLYCDQLVDLPTSWLVLLLISNKSQTLLPVCTRILLWSWLMAV